MATDPLALVAARKTSEMRAKTSALREELDAWRELAKPNGPFEKHHSQILRLSEQFGAALAATDAGADENASQAQILARARGDEVMLLELHRVWDFFRSKLLQRSEPYRRFLVVADELAWACYEPAVKRAKAARREPPLTFFNAEPSPYAIERDKAYATEILGGPVAGAAAADLLKALPVPVIGVPWFQSSHLPDLVMTAHEVGHHVEEDLRLTKQLRAVITAAIKNTQRRAAWLAWAGEVFADVYGTLALGPAFPVALSAFLAESKQSIETQVIHGPGWGFYPTAYLRMLVTFEVLRDPFDAERDTLKAAWKQAFPAHAMSSYEDDATNLAAALVDAELTSGETKFRLRDLVSFSALSQKNARTAMNAALGGAGLQTNDVRELIAAAALAFDANPTSFNQLVGNRTPQQRIVDHVLQHIQSGPRSAARLQQMQKSVAGSKKSDQVAGTDLAVRLRKLAKLRDAK